jgi:hypothetical protein
VFLRAKILHLYPTRINVRMFIFFPFRRILSRYVFFRCYYGTPIMLIIYARFAVFSLYAAVCCGRRDQLKEIGHICSVPWTSTAGRRPYFVQFRQEAETAGAVAFDGDLAAHSQIVGSEELTTRSTGP